MLKPAVQNAINDQINKELYSAYLYLSMSAYCESVNLMGFAHWMRLQAREEIGHAMKFFEYVHDRGGRVLLEAIEKPPVEFESAFHVIEETYNHEQQVTASINNVFEVALQEKDYATQAELQWFITEQVEEEKNAATILEQLKMAGDNRTALLMIDRALGKRAAGA